MLKHIALFSLLVFPAWAQQAPEPGGQAWQLMYQREVAAHHQDLGAALQMQEQVKALTTQVADLQKEIEAAKPKP